MEITGILFDTNAYTAFKSGLHDAVNIFTQAPILYLNSIVLGELQSGFAVGTRQNKNQHELELLLQINKVRFLSINQITAGYYAQVYKNLRQKGQPIPTNDMWIAAIALQNNLPLFTYDKHFSAVDNVKVGNTLIDFVA